THEGEFLEDISRVCGDWDALATSLSTARGGPGSGGRTYTASTRRERVLDVPTLAALPPSRAVVMPSGTYPLVVRKVAWHQDKARRRATPGAASLASVLPGNAGAVTAEAP
ncbi:MAG: hypothetical protein ACP5VR_13475, partial [Acidimicrobiales bacterium]